MARPRASSEERSRRTVIAACVGASLLFWFVIKFSEEYTTVEEIAVDYQLPAGQAFARLPPRTIEATVRATGWELLAQSLRRRERAITIDSADVNANPDGIVPVRRAVAQSFAEIGLTVEAMTNERVLLRTERVGAKRVPLRLVGRITYANGFSATGAPMLTPDSATVTAPRSLLDTLRAWPTDSLSLTALRDTVTVVQALGRPRLPSVRVQPAEAEVTLPVGPVTEKSVYVPVEVVGAGPGDSISLYPRRVLVTAAVALDEYERVGPQSFRAAVDLAGYEASSESGAVRLPVTVGALRPGIARVAVDPKLVEVYVVRSRPER